MGGRFGFEFFQGSPEPELLLGVLRFLDGLLEDFNAGTARLLKLTHGRIANLKGVIGQLADQSGESLLVRRLLLNRFESPQPVARAD